MTPILWCVVAWMAFLSALVLRVLWLLERR